MKIVLNKDYGGFSVSKAIYDYLDMKYDGYGFDFNKDRTNSKLIEAIEAIGESKASGGCASLEIVEIPDNSYYVINEYDGYETIYYSESEIEIK